MYAGRTGIRRYGGVNLVGSFTTESGIGQGVRNAAAALEAAGVPYVAHDFTHHSAHPPHGRVLFPTVAWDMQPFDTNIVHVNPDHFKTFCTQVGPLYFAGKRTIAYWTLETPMFPRKWMKHFRWIDELWVPSTFVQRIIAPHSPVPVRVVPHPVVVEPDFRLTRTHFGLPKQRFLFLFCFDFHSISERKNPLGLLQAYRDAFRKDDTVGLVLKCGNATHAPCAFAQLQEAAAALPTVSILNWSLPLAHLHSLMHLCDCYVSLHRSEGFGLTIAESMALGKPVIATRYGGNTDFMNDENSFPVDCRFTAVPAGFSPYRRGDIWADPNLAQASQIMRTVVSDPETASLRAGRAFTHMTQHYIPERTGSSFARLRTSSYVAPEANSSAIASSEAITSFML